MKIKMYRMSTAIIRDILKPGMKHLKVLENGLPDDAELVRISVDPHLSTADAFCLFFTSKSFPDLPEGTILDGENIRISEYIGKKEAGYFCYRCSEIVEEDPYNPNFLVCHCNGIGQVDPNGTFPDSWKKALITKIIEIDDRF